MTCSTVTDPDELCRVRTVPCTDCVVVNCESTVSNSLARFCSEATRIHAYAIINFFGKLYKYGFFVDIRVTLNFPINYSFKSPQFLVEDFFILSV